VGKPVNRLVLGAEVKKPSLVGEHDRQEHDGRQGESNNEEDLLRDLGAHVAQVRHRILRERVSQNLLPKRGEKKKKKSPQLKTPEIICNRKFIRSFRRF